MTPSNSLAPDADFTGLPTLPTILTGPTTPLRVVLAAGADAHKLIGGGPGGLTVVVAADLDADLGATLGARRFSVEVSHPFAQPPHDLDPDRHAYLPTVEAVEARYGAGGWFARRPAWLEAAMTQRGTRPARVPVTLAPAAADSGLSALLDVGVWLQTLTHDGGYRLTGLTLDFTRADVPAQRPVPAEVVPGLVRLAHDCYQVAALAATVRLAPPNTADRWSEAWGELAEQCRALLLDAGQPDPRAAA